MKFLLPIALLLLPLAVFSQEKEKDPFAGMDKQAIIQKFGKPTEVRQTAGKSEVLVYKKEIQAGPGNSGQVFVSRQTYTFLVDEKGKIVSSAFEPASQPAEPIIAN